MLDAQARLEGEILLAALIRGGCVHALIIASTRQGFIRPHLIDPCRKER